MVTEKGLQELVIRLLKNTLHHIENPYMIIGVSSNPSNREERELYIEYLIDLREWTNEKPNFWFCAWEEYTGYSKEKIQTTFQEKIDNKLKQLQK